MCQNLRWAAATSALYLPLAPLPTALPTASQWAGHDTQGPDDDELDPGAVNGGDGGGEALDMHWNVASFLPESLREHFEVLVGEFIFRPWKRERGDADGDGAGGSAKPDLVALDEEGDEAHEFVDLC